MSKPVLFCICLLAAVTEAAADSLHFRRDTEYTYHYESRVEFGDGVSTYIHATVRKSDGAVVQGCNGYDFDW